MAKKDKSNDIDEMAEDLLRNLDLDRKRLSDFLDDLLKVEDPSVIAEPVAKIADALTRQNHLRIDAMKAKIKKEKDAPNQDDDLFDEIDRPFTQEEEGSN